MVQEGELALNNHCDSLSSVTLVSDSLAAPDAVYGLLLTPPQPPEQAPYRTSGNEGVSFILGALFILFLVISLRFRNNFKYVLTMFQNLIETRTRQNVFDDTVRETSLIVMLNILWCACAGIICFCVFQYYHPDSAACQRAVGMLVGMAMAACYSLFLWGAYTAIGWIFSDSSHSALWVKGFSASQALMAPAFFITALVAICQQEAAVGAAMATVIVFLFAKLTFIWKSYRIFFNQFSSWVLFLCYLCSLEIVPLVICYRSAILLGKVL